MRPPKPILRQLAPMIRASAMLIACCALWPAPARAVFTNGKLQVIHLDAGQGDGAFIITPGGQVALVDEGTNFTAGTSPPSCSRVLSELQALGVTHVDLHFASHYHADHIGCITSLTGITIDQGWDRGESYTTATYTNYVNYLGGKRHTLTKGRVFTLDSLSAHPVTITCVALAGDGITTSDENSKCLVLKVSYGEFNEVFGGDLTGYPSGTSSSNTNIETKVGSQVGKVEVYKVHHHGSAYCSYDDWLNATQPKVGVISCGTGNSYGHPTAAALTRLHNHSVRTYWTELGSGATPNPAWDKVANDQIKIYAVWQPGGVDSILAPGIADTLTNSLDGSVAAVMDGPVAPFALFSPVPNPSHGAVSLRFALARTEPAQLEVLDVAGRSLWRADQGLLGAGEHQVSWSGYDLNGLAMPTGMYLVRLTSSGWSLTRKMVLLR